MSQIRILFKYILFQDLHLEWTSDALQRTECLNVNDATSAGYEAIADIADDDDDDFVQINIYYLNIMRTWVTCN